MMVKSKRLVVVLLVMMGVLFGCGEDDLGGVAKVTGTLPAIGSQIGTEGVLVVTFDDSSNIGTWHGGYQIPCSDDREWWENA